MNRKQLFNELEKEVNEQIEQYTQHVQMKKIVTEFLNLAPIIKEQNPKMMQLIEEKMMQLREELEK